MATRQERRGDGAPRRRCRWCRTAARASRVGRQRGRVFPDSSAKRGPTASSERSARRDGRWAMTNRVEVKGRDGDVVDGPELRHTNDVPL